MEIDHEYPPNSVTAIEPLQVIEDDSDSPSEDEQVSNEPPKHHQSLPDLKAAKSLVSIKSAAEHEYATPM